MTAPVSSRVAGEADRLLRNHDERLRVLESRAQTRRFWRPYSAHALMTTSQAILYTKSSSQFIAGQALTALWPFEIRSDERLLAVHALVRASAPGTIDLRVMKTTPTGLEQIGKRPANLGTADELVSVDGIRVQPKVREMAGYELLVAMANTDIVLALALETEPVG